MTEHKIDTSLDEIIEFEEKDIATIPESTFKRTLLPMIASTDNKDADFSLWLQVAGSWRRAVDVLDDKTNEFLFRVPALVGRNEAPVVQTGRNSAYEIIRNAQRKMQIVPRAGEEHLIQNLRPRITASGDLEENRRMWQFIYKRYGLEFQTPGQTEEQQQASESSGKGPTKGPDVVGYDEI